MKLTQEVIDQIQEAMNHTKKDGSFNWKDDDEIRVSVSCVQHDGTNRQKDYDLSFSRENINNIICYDG